MNAKANISSSLNNRLAVNEAYSKQAIEDRIEQYVPYKKPEDVDKEELKAEDYLERYSQWSNDSMAALSRASTLAGAHAERIQVEENQLLESLHNLLQRPEGRNQLEQVGGMIALEHTKQMQKFRQLQGAQVNAEASYMAFNENEKAAQEMQDNYFYTRDEMKNKETRVSNSRGDLTGNVELRPY